MLVAMSVTEEGLDIGEIDVVVCYNVQKSTIRMVGQSRHIYECQFI